MTFFFLIFSIYRLLSTDTGLSLSQSLQVLSCHIPFLVSSVEDFKDHIPRETDMKVKHTHRLLHLIVVLRYVLLPHVHIRIRLFAGGHERLRAVVSSRSTL